MHEVISMSIVNPAVDPANQDTLAGVLKEVVHKMTQSLDGMLPAKVLGYSAGPPPMVQVQPMVMMVNTDQQTVSRGQIASVPVVQLGGGNFFLHFPIQPGDLGWILANDRDISVFMQSFTEAKPGSLRKKSFSDAIFIPQTFRNYTLDGADEAGLVLQSLDGTVKIVLLDDTIRVKAPQVHLEGTVLVNGDITIEGGGGAQPIKFTGDMYVDGNIAASGSITPDVPPE
jgi:hypothetical protein